MIYICCCSVAQSCPTLWVPMDCSTPGFPVLHYLPEIAQTHLHWISDAIQPTHPPAPNPSQHQGVFQWVALHIRWPKYWSSSSNISPSNECLGLISFRIDWFDLLTGQVTLKSLLQHHTLKASIFWCSTFFVVQLSQPYMTIGETIALTRQTFVSKVMFLLFNMLSRYVIAFLPRNNLLSLWLKPPSTVISVPKKRKSATAFIVSPSICYEVMGPDAMILVFWMLGYKPAFSLSSFTFIKKLFSFFSLSAIRIVSSAYLRLLILLLEILIPACASSSLAFRMMYFAYELNKQDNNI